MAKTTMFNNKNSRNSTMNKTITVKYGPDSFSPEVPTGFTVGDLKNDERIQTALGFGDNINVLIDGVVQGDGVVIPPLACVKVETAANQKAA
jgi:hypothetical protein